MLGRVGKGAERRAHHTIYPRAVCWMVGTLALCPPYDCVTFPPSFRDGATGSAGRADPVASPRNDDHGLVATRRNYSLLAPIATSRALRPAARRRSPHRAPSRP